MGYLETCNTTIVLFAYRINIPCWILRLANIYNKVRYMYISNSINTCIPSLALPLTFLRKSGDIKLLWSATSNAPAPGITQPTITPHGNKTLHEHHTI